MKFEITLKRGSISSFLRECGYVPVGINSETKKQEFIRSFSGTGYPRFHIYSKELENRIYALNLHLDQKRPTYQGVSAHSGEYEGPLVEKEVRRIKNVL